MLSVIAPFRPPVSVLFQPPASAPFRPLGLALSQAPDLALRALDSGPIRGYNLPCLTGLLLLDLWPFGTRQSALGDLLVPRIFDNIEQDFVSDLRKSLSESTRRSAS